LATKRESAMTTPQQILAFAALGTVAACAGAGESQAGVSTAGAKSSTAKSATFDTKNELKVNVPDGAKSVRIWCAMPQETPEETVKDFSVECALPNRIVKDDHGNTTVYVETKDMIGKEIAISEKFQVRRREVVAPADTSMARPLTDSERER